MIVTDAPRLMMVFDKKDKLRLTSAYHKPNLGVGSYIKDDGYWYLRTKVRQTRTHGSYWKKVTVAELPKELKTWALIQGFVL